jgi:hydrophobic/amphiphilic exporter-1 (mainly G- bacteria), HAE1 family
VFLTRGATRNPVFVLMASIAVVVLSEIAVSRLPTDLFPRISIPAMTVVTNYRGASPEAGSARAPRRTCPWRAR